MDFSMALALIGATVVMVLIPGPNLALFIANTLAYGFRAGAVTVLGTALGVAIQLVLVMVGLAAVLSVAASALIWLKWAGAAYLVWLGIVAWRRGAETAVEVPPQQLPAHRMVLQGVVISTLNPKTLLFHIAFLPQFVSVDAGVLGLTVPIVIYLTVILIGDLLWVACAGSARPLIAKLGRLRHRLTGALFITAGIGLALSRAPR